MINVPWVEQSLVRRALTRHLRPDIVGIDLRQANCSCFIRTERATDNERPKLQKLTSLRVSHKNGYLKTFAMLASCYIPIEWLIAARKRVAHIPNVLDRLRLKGLANWDVSIGRDDSIRQPLDNSLLVLQQVTK